VKNPKITARLMKMGMKAEMMVTRYLFCWLIGRWMDGMGRMEWMDGVV